MPYLDSVLVGIGGHRGHHQGSEVASFMADVLLRVDLIGYRPVKDRADTKF